MPVVYFEEPYHLSKFKKPALKLIEKVKKLNFLNIDRQVFELFSLDVEFKNALHNLKRYAMRNKRNPGAEETLSDFMTLAYQNGVKNLNPFVRFLNSHTTKTFLEFKKEIDALTAGGNKYPLTFYRTIEVNEKDLDEVKANIRKIKKQVHYIEKGNYQSRVKGKRATMILEYLEHCEAFYKKYRVA